MLLPQGMERVVFQDRRGDLSIDGLWLGHVIVESTWSKYAEVWRLQAMI